MVKLNTLLKKRAVIYWKYIILIAKKAASYSGVDSFSKNYIIYKFWKWLSLVFEITVEYKIMLETWYWTPDFTLSNLQTQRLILNLVVRRFGFLKSWRRGVGCCKSSVLSGRRTGYDNLRPGKDGGLLLREVGNSGGFWTGVL